MRTTSHDYDRPRALYMPRTRGALTGSLLILLGAWGALVPFFGPNIDWVYMTDPAWTWTTAKGWLEVLPGAAAAVGGLLVLMSGNRASAVFGGWLAVAGGAWFVVGRAFASTLGIGDVGQPMAATDLKRALLEVTYFTGLGALIVFLGGAAVARLAVRHARDVVVTPPAPVAGEAVPTAEPAMYDETRAPAAARADAAAAGAEPRGRTGRGLFRRRAGGGLFHRHHHAGA
ncbi:hypothetical protein MMAN_05360 [Mycobacterium mantenii]|uniref:Secreted protein n=1 Tax=Mycobacterium mantenii TaxID=560555 RepID=A0A1X0FXN5_MYCNT|nr:hypothetical protein [Mycobacterium mantenii]MCV7242699.1 hypothetical protein [Mycobacterium mantenii]ORB06534.1 hypothetical protein BST30_10870 [Mycobacterium mantenii]BBY36402.1 hypothetical protein MMAN_05360 [Mycobacterium mantenii]